MHKISTCLKLKWIKVDMETELHVTQTVYTTTE